MTLPAKYATTPCRGCGRPVIFVSVAKPDGSHATVPLDPSAPVFYRESDGEGGGVWVQDRTREILVSHFATCSKANEFSGKGRDSGRGAL